jgi:ABC-type uncharacterized transport system ATPase subunit
MESLTFIIPQSSIFGFLGHNGAGRTSNKLSIKRISYLLEERGFYKKMKVSEQALYLAVQKGLTNQESEKRIKQWFKKLAISDWWDKKVDTLSKGMQQKVQFDLLPLSVLIEYYQNTGKDDVIPQGFLDYISPALNVTSLQNKNLIIND